MVSNASTDTPVSKRGNQMPTMASLVIHES
jgi:hypothetical protein